MSKPLIIIHPSLCGGNDGREEEGNVTCVHTHTHFISIDSLTSVVPSLRPTPTESHPPSNFKFFMATSSQQQLQSAPI